jgi:hypothetical protein
MPRVWVESVGAIVSDDANHSGVQTSPSFFRPDQIFWRFLYGYTAGALWLGVMWVLWIMPSWCMTMRFTGDDPSPHGLFAPTQAYEHTWTVQGTYIIVNPMGFAITVCLTVLFSYYYIWLAHTWLTGSRESFIQYNAKYWGLLWYRLDREAQRQRRGQCPQCGYDLRGDLKSGCPECGWNRTGSTV